MKAVKRTTPYGATTPMIVTKGNHSFNKGDHFYFTKDRGVVCKEAGGWLDKDYAVEGMKGVEYEIDEEGILKIVAKLVEAIEMYYAMLDKRGDSQID